MCSNMLWLNILLFIIGLVALVKGSGWFIDGAAYIAKCLKIPDAIVGLTLVSIGTSLPELATNVYSAATGNPEIAMGVIPGSNIANILLVLGVTLIIMREVPVSKLMFHRDTILLVSVFVIFAIFCYFFPNSSGVPAITRSEAGILLIIFVIYIIKLLKNKEQLESETNSEENTKPQFINTMLRAIFALVCGGILVAVGSQLMVDNIVWIADKKLHIPAEIIAATIIAIGTSVPELAVTIAGVIKGKSDIALGNIIGSCIMNLIFVMGITGMVAEIPVVSDASRMVLVPFMLLAGFVLLIFMRSNWKLKRWEGIIMLIIFIVFIIINLLQIIS